MHQDSQVSRSKSNIWQEGTDKGRERTYGQKHRSDEMETRKCRFRRNSITHLLPLQIDAHLHRHTHISYWHLETFWYRQNRDESLPQGTDSWKHDLQSSDPAHHYQHPTWRWSDKLLVSRSLWVIKKIESSHCQLRVEENRRPQKNWQFKQEERRVGNFTSWWEDLGTQGNGEDDACYYWQ